MNFADRFVKKTVPSKIRKKIASLRKWKSLKYLIEQNKLFDEDFYINKYPDIINQNIDPYHHYISIGIDEGRQPSLLFDVDFYIGDNADVEKRPRAALDHYLRIGKSRGSLGNSPYAGLSEFAVLTLQSNLFVKDWYLDRHPDIKNADIDPFKHFIENGHREGRDPGPDFETAYYAEKNPQILDSGFSPFEHYVRIGKMSGIICKGPPIYERWLARFDDLNQDDITRIKEDAKSLSVRSVKFLHIAGQGTLVTPDIERELATQLGFPANVSIITDAGAVVDKMLDRLEIGSMVILSSGSVRLHRHAGFTFALALEDARLDAAYSDHDHLSQDGVRFSPVFKPQISPDYLRQVPYAGPVVCVRVSKRTRPLIATAIRQAVVGDPSAAFGELLLAIWKHVAHVPLPLYSIREGAGESSETMPHIRYEPNLGFVTALHQPLPAKLPKVSIIIPTRNSLDILKECIDSIFAVTDYPSNLYDIIIVDNNSDDLDTLNYFSLLKSSKTVRIVESPGIFNFAKICNDGADVADGDILIFLNNDMSVIAPDWIKVLVTHASRPEIGIVGPRLLYPDGTVQHGGVVVGVQGVGAHRLVGIAEGAAARHDVTREMSAVTGACIAMRRNLFEEVGRFNTVLGVAFNDIALCLSVINAGYRNLYIAKSMLFHHESKSRGLDDSRPKRVRNTLEAIWTREHFTEFFLNDRYYSPNLSLQQVGEIAFPPRAVRPWRRSKTGRKIMLLSITHGMGHGVGAVIELQAKYLVRHGWDVTVGGPATAHDRHYPNCRRVKLHTAEEAAGFAVAEGLDCVVVHTPPFFSIMRYLGRWPLVYAFDHGEPIPSLFPDNDARSDIDLEKRFCFPLMRRIFAISQSIAEEQYSSESIILRNGNSHLAKWSNKWKDRRDSLREKYYFDGKFVILNVCRFHAAERHYKGVDQYMDLAVQSRYLVPILDREIIFVLVGRGDKVDVAHVEASGVRVMSNVTNEEMAEIYAASDLYVNLSKWEGYNLGIGQALAMGLNVIASDIPAHREFSIPVSNSTPQLCRLIANEIAFSNDENYARHARIDEWDNPISKLVSIIRDDIDFHRNNFFHINNDII